MDLCMLRGWAPPALGRLHRNQELFTFSQLSFTVRFQAKPHFENVMLFHTTEVCILESEMEEVTSKDLWEVVNADLENCDFGSSMWS